MTQGVRGKKRCHFSPEGDTIGNAITRKCKLGMLTYTHMDISLCPPEWYQSAKFGVVAHALLPNVIGIVVKLPWNYVKVTLLTFKSSRDLDMHFNYI